MHIVNIIYNWLWECAINTNTINIYSTLIEDGFLSTYIIHIIFTLMKTNYSLY